MVRSPTSLAVGMLLTLVTVYSLLSGVFAGEEPLAPAHAMSVGALLALMVGVHQYINQKSRVVKAALSVFCVATVVFILVSAGTRNFVTAATPSQQYSTKLAFLKEQLERENRVLAQSDQKKNNACLRPKSNKCLSATAKQQDAERRRDATQRTILGLQAPPDRSVAYASLAANLMLPMLWADKMEAWMHYVQVLLCELGAALFVSLGLKPIPKPKQEIKKKIRKKKRPGRTPRPPVQIIPFRKTP